ncbi:D-alanine--poly(phosphoribitol) ligase, partial [Streptomyces sp. SID7803]|nr:D-alanine--poly(phosphoribitol) ligase [Streptomyces sp. SID7803]
MEPMTSKALHARFLRGGLEKSPEGIAVRVGGGDSVDYTTAHATALAWAGALLAAPGG